MKSCCEESCGCDRTENQRPRRKLWIIAFGGAAALVVVLQLVLG